MKRVIPVVLALCGLLMLVSWMPLARMMALRVEVQDVIVDNIVVPDVIPLTPEQVSVGPGQPADSTASHPAFRGADGGNVRHDDVPLARSWPDGGPPILWHTELGLGHSGFAVHKGRVFIQDYDEEGRRDMVRCLSLDDGQEIWHNAYDCDFAPNHGFTRATPSVTDRHVVALGPTAVLMCLDLETGQRRWALNLPEEFRAVVPGWWSAQSPIIDDDAVIVAIGGHGRDITERGVLMAAFSLEPGPDGRPKTLWTTPNRRGDLAWNMTHASISRCLLDGRLTYVYPFDRGVAAVWADTGVKAWDSTLWQVNTATVTHVIDCGDNRLFCAGGYRSGAVMLQIEVDGSHPDGSPRHVARELWRLRATARGYGAEQHNPMLIDGILYGVNTSNGQMVALSLDDGRQLWNSGREHRYGLGPYLVANGLTLAMDPDGRLDLAEMTPDGYQVLASHQFTRHLASVDVDDKLHNAWATMTLVDGRLLVRDQTLAFCLDVSAP